MCLKVFYRYGEAAMIGLAFSSLLGGMVSFLMSTIFLRNPDPFKGRRSNC